VSGDRRRASGHADREDRRIERRTHLLDAAVDAIRAVGPGITMDQLAKAGGVTKPILYRHFGDRDGLINAISERFSVDLLVSVTAPLANDTSTLELLRTTVDSYIGFIERETNLYRFMIHPQLHRSTGRSGASALVDLVAQQVAVVADERLQDAGRSEGAAIPWAYGIVGLVHQAGDWWVDDQTITREALVEHLVSLLWGGLQPRPPDEPAA
jgi:AcrR family transcriptional regulator